MITAIVLLSVAALAMLAIIAILIVIIVTQEKEIEEWFAPVKPVDVWHDSDFVMYAGDKHGKRE